MGSMCTRERRTRRGADYRAEEGNTDNKQTDRAANQSEDNSDKHNIVFLHNPDDPKTGVNFGVHLEKKDDRFVLKDVREDGLAYKTGFRSGDVLVMANSIDIENVGLKLLLKKLLDYDETNYIIGVERKLDDGKKTFLWKIFKITIKDGVADVAVLQALENDKNVLPDIAIDPTYDFLRVSSRTYNIYIDEDQEPTKYLAISEDKELVFQDYNESSKFYQYYYTDPKRNRGTVVAYSLNRITREDTDVGSDSDSSSSEEDSAKSSPATSTDKKTAIAMVFPKKMTGDGIPPDPRFWYKLVSQGGFTLESMIADGMYLGNGSDNKAILSKTETNFQIALDAVFCESNSVE